MEWDVPYEPTLIANVDLYVPYYSDISPLFGVKWKQWNDSKGARARSRRPGPSGCSRSPRSGGRVAPGSDRYMELGKGLVKLNLENMTIIGTIGELPKPVIVANGLHNVKPRHEDGALQFRLHLPVTGRDQWFKS